MKAKTVLIKERTESEQCKLHVTTLQPEVSSDTKGNRSESESESEKE